MKKATLLIVAVFMFHDMALKAQAIYCPDTNCTRCRLMRAVDYQFNALRLGNIALPSTLDGRSLQWELKGSSPYISLNGHSLFTTSLPLDGYTDGGTLLCRAGDETVRFNLTIAPDDAKFGYLYCHMSGTSENTLYALGTKDDRGLLFHPLLNNQPIYDPEVMAEIEGGVRDAFICRGQDNNYLMVTTDMSNRKSRSWFNHGIDLMKSNDLIHWTSVSIDFRRGKEAFSDPQSKDWFADYTKVNRVWAPQVIWDKDYNNGQGGYLVYYSMLSSNPGDDHDRIYYSYANREFTTLTKPQLMHDRGISIIDCHIDWNDCDQMYHVFFKKEGVAGVDRGIYKAVFDRLPTGQWRDILHITNEGASQVEGPSAFRLINENKWKVAYINYGVNPKIYRVCEANATLENIDKGPEIGRNVNPQHGSFMTVTKEEYDLLEAWSELSLRVQEMKNDPKLSKSKKVQAAQAALEVTFETNAVNQLLTLYTKTLKNIK